MEELVFVVTEDGFFFSIIIFILFFSRITKEYIWKQV